jgi:hypothetical protein
MMSAFILCSLARAAHFAASLATSGNVDAAAMASGMADEFLTSEEFMGFLKDTAHGESVDEVVSIVDLLQADE